jgi:hypothetical protein
MRERGLKLDFQRGEFLKFALILSTLLSACGEIDFQPHLTPRVQETIEKLSLFETPAGLAA